jgi:hypothetical protein
MVSFEQRALAAIAALLLVAAVVIGCSARSVTTIGGAQYSCGSGFVHSQQTWSADSQGLPTAARGVGSSSATPISACPSSVSRSRNLAILLGVLAILSAVIVFGLGDPSTVSGRTRYTPPRTPTPLH